MSQMSFKVCLDKSIFSQYMWLCEFELESEINVFSSPSSVQCIQSTWEIKVYSNNHAIQIFIFLVYPWKSKQSNLCSGMEETFYFLRNTGRNFFSFFFWESLFPPFWVEPEETIGSNAYESAPVQEETMGRMNVSLPRPRPGGWCTWIAASRSWIRTIMAH